uniref:C2H2-type domain-containing protein n=1 Tax=Astatotilapia calliptera TaxID=8154 RepID=A0A3P8R9W2_ASTCA
MENSSVYMCFPCYQEFNTLEEVLKHQLTCTAGDEPPDTSGTNAVTIPVLQTQVSDEVSTSSDQPRILYQCGDCDELFKSLVLWQQHRKEGACQQSDMSENKSKPDSETMPETSSVQSATIPLYSVAESSFSQHETNKNINSDAVEKALHELEQQEGTETNSSQSSDPPISEVVSVSNPDESSPKRRGANKKPKPEPVLLCVDCGSCFGLVSELVAHRKTQHGFEEALHRCSVCGESFLNTTLFLYHRKQHRQKGEEKAVEVTELTSEVFTQSNGADQQDHGAPSASASVDATFTQPELFVCTLCLQSFSDEGGLVTHRKQKHNLNEPLHTCAHCDMSFMNTTQYLYHWRQHRFMPVTEVADGAEAVDIKEELEANTGADSDNTNHPPPAKLLQDWARTPLPHVCPYCGKTFTRRVFLRTHVYSHTGEKLFTCKVCTKSFTNSQSLLRHSMSHTGNKPFSCDVCGKNFSQAATLKRHQRIHTSTLPRRKRGRKPVCSLDNEGAAHLFPCPNCPSRSRQAQTSHQISTRPLACSMTRNYDHLSKIRHCSITDKQPATCPHCSSQFINQSVLEIHLQRCPTTEEEKNTGRGRGQGRGRCTGQIECDLCGHRCMTQEGLDLHRLSHTGQTPLKCPVRPCRRRFISNSALEEHVLAHFQGTLSKSKNRPRFRCQICHKEFAYNSTFNVHMRTHTDERPFECATCGKRFRQLPHLQDHERIHSGVRPFCCWICGKSFSVAARLTEHARTHSGEKPYPCPHCPAAFRSRSNLDKHIRLHGDLPPETAEQVVNAAEAAQVQKVLEGAKALSSLATMEEGASQVVILPSSVLGTQAITVPTITMDGSEITMVETSQSPQHTIEFIMEETV